VRTGAIGNESVPIQLAQCWFPELAISSAKNINTSFEYNIRKQFYQTAPRKLLCFEITKMLIAVLINKLTVSFVIIFGTLSLPTGACFNRT